jgi:beta-1,4-N-acetylglucosaminyltransferase
MAYLHIVAILAIPLLIALRIYQILPGNTGSLPKKRKAEETCSLGIFLGSGKLPYQYLMNADELCYVGGHTAEMRTLLSTIDFTRYTPRTYVYCHGDEMSLRVISDLEKSTEKSDSTMHDVETAPTSQGRSDVARKRPKMGYTLLPLPRARKVGQPALSTLVSTVRTMLMATCHLFLLPLLNKWRRPIFDILLINGPGTCVVLVVVSYIRRVSRDDPLSRYGTNGSPKFLGLSHTRIIYVESFARVKSLSLSAKLLKHLVDVFVVQWPDLAKNQDNVTYKGWLV